MEPAMGIMSIPAEYFKKVEIFIDIFTICIQNINFCAFH